MFDIFKKQVTASVYAHETWLFCCNCAEKFCLEYRPKLQEVGYIQNPSANKLFMDETMRLHLWIISRALGAENRDILDALHNHAHGLNFVNSVSLRDLYAIYDTVASRERELQDAGVGWPLLAKAAIQRLVNDSNFSDVVIPMLVHVDIQIVISAVRETRSRFKIRKS